MHGESEVSPRHGRMPRRKRALEDGRGLARRGLRLIELAAVARDRREAVIRPADAGMLATEPRVVDHERALVRRLGLGELPAIEKSRRNASPSRSPARCQGNAHRGCAP